MVPYERAMMVSYKVTIALSLTIRPQFAIKYLRRSNQQGVGHFGAKFGEGWVTVVSQILPKSGRDTRLSYAKRNCVDILCRLSTM